VSKRAARRSLPDSPRGSVTCCLATPRGAARSRLRPKSGKRHLPFVDASSYSRSNSRVMPSSPSFLFSVRSSARLGAAVLLCAAPVCAACAAGPGDNATGAGSSTGGNASNGGGTTTFGDGGGGQGEGAGFNSGGGAEGGGCAGEDYVAEKVPLDIYLMLDQSGSMSDGSPLRGGTRSSARSRPSSRARAPRASASASNISRSRAATTAACSSATTTPTAARAAVRAWAPSRSSTSRASVRASPKATRATRSTTPPPDVGDRPRCPPTAAPSCSR
jgi:hypothetical protein